MPLCVRVKDQWPQVEQLPDEQEAQPPPEPPEGAELPEPMDAYFARPKADMSFLVFFDLHLGQATGVSSLILKETCSNSFLHLSQRYSYMGIGMGSFPVFP